MKNFYSYVMVYTVSTMLLTACEDGSNSYQPPVKILAELDDSTVYTKLFRFRVGARNWERVSSSDRYVEISLAEINEEVLKEGSVIIYLNEAGKNIALPFTYYQVRRAISFQPSYEKGKAYINILGNFILSTGTSYNFRLLIVNGKGLRRFKTLNWYNFDEVQCILSSRKK